MKRLIELARGFTGHPSHPPLTDATIGALTAGAVLALLGWIGIAERRMAEASFVVIVVGLAFAVPTILTGLLDYLRIRKGTPMRRTANLHWWAMSSAAVLFLIAAILLQAGGGDRVPAGAGLVALLAWLALIAGGWIGGAIVFVYGMRVQMEPGTPTAEALTPKLPRADQPAAEE